MMSGLSIITLWSKLYRSEILSIAHLGVNKTGYKILNHFYWPGLKASVSNYSRPCHTWQVVGKPNKVIPKATLYISDGFVKTKIYDKRDDFDFDIVNFPFLDGDVPRSASYGVYISQLIRFARVSSHVDDFNTRNKVLTAKLLRQGYRYHKLRKAFSKFYRRHFDIVSKYNVGLKTLLLQGLSEPEFYGDLVYKFRKIIGKIDFPYHFKKIIVRYKKIGYNINVMRQTACLVVNPIKVNSFAYLFNCTTVGRTSD